jgi:hypothetical protein
LHGDDTLPAAQKRTFTKTAGDGSTWQSAAPGKTGAVDAHGVFYRLDQA